ncbi:MAG TPA: CehA/McbA family metallohydrolase [Kofleriaceae bacterium]|nr:CehA/McbA family metallohydrolase [Kofleriaceae bacterium]
MNRRLACTLLSGLGGLAMFLVARHGTAHPHVRHATGTLSIEIRGDDNALIPARLTFRPVGDTPKLFFTTIDIGREEAGAIAAFDRAFVLRGDADLRIPAGTYDVWVSHGPEWDTARERVTIKPAAETEVKLKLHHVIDTPGWISADLHVHSAASLDSRVPMRDRVFQFVADGVDLIVATDHNVVADYAPVIAELGVSDLLGSATGDEITTKQWGHFGAFPLPADEGELGHGAIETGKRSAAQIFADVRAKAPQALIDVHHPRLEHGQLGYFFLSDLDLATGKTKTPGFSFDFDAIEVLNGYQDSDRKTMAQVIGDWIAFLDAGKRVACTGNSDSHHMTFNLGGYPRNYVALANTAPAKIDPALVAAQVKAGHSFFTTGPIVEATIAGKTYGEIASVARGKATLHVVVRAANWIPVTKLTVIGPGNTVLATRAIAQSKSAVKLDEQIELPATRDGYAIVRVDGDRPMAPNVGDIGSFLVYPVAVTNPIWIDVDGDQKITPLAPYPAPAVTPTP